MKKTLSVVLAVLLLTLCLSVPASAENGVMEYVFDMNDTLTFEEWETLENLASDISERHNCGIYIFIVDDYTQYGSGDTYDVATQIFNSSEYDFGFGEEHNGVILLLSMVDRDFSLFFRGSDTEYAFGSYAQKELENTFIDDLQEDDWYGAFATYLNTCDEYLLAAENGDPVEESPVFGVVIAILVSCLIAMVVCLIMKGKMRTVRRKAEARSYVVGGLNLTDSYDRYTHTTETRRRIERNQTQSQAHTGGGGSGRSGKF